MNDQDRLKAPAELNGRHRQTFEAIVRHPPAHNLEWHDVRSLLAALGDVVKGHNGVLHISRNGQIMNLHVPKDKDVAQADDLLSIRRFLELSGEAAIPPAIASGVHLLVVIDHHEAKVYRTELRGSVPLRIEPYDPHGFGRHLRSENPETDGKREPERKSYYEAIAATLRGADDVVVFGRGTGESSATGHLLAELKHNHQDLADRVIGSVSVDEHHLTEGQLLAKARECFGRFLANVRVRGESVDDSGGAAKGRTSREAAHVLEPSSAGRDHGRRGAETESDPLGDEIATLA